MSQIRWVQLVACLLVFLAPSTGESARILEWKLEPEQQYRVVVEWQSDTVTDQVNVSNSTTCDLTWAIKSVADDGTYEIAQTLTHVKQTLQTPDGALFQYDSKAAGETKGTTALLASYWKPLLGVERTFRMTPAGEVVKNAETATLAAAENLLVSQSFGNESWRNAIQQGSVVLPADGLEPNQAWSEPQTMNLPGDAAKLTITRSYSYEGERELDEGESKTKLDVIRVANRFELETAEGKTSPLSIVQQNGEGEILFDGEAGRLVSSNLEQRLRLRYQVDDRESDSRLNTSFKMTFQPLPKPEETAGDAAASAAGTPP